MSLVDGLLTHTCDVLRPSVSQTPRGGDKTDSIAVVQTGVECLINQASQRMIDAMGGKSINMSHVGYFQIEEGRILQTNDILTNVASEDCPGVYETDNFGSAGVLPTQYRVINSTAPNLGADHVEVALEQMQGRKVAPPS